MSNVSLSNSNVVFELLNYMDNVTFVTFIENVVSIVNAKVRISTC